MAPAEKETAENVFEVGIAPDDLAVAADEIEARLGYPPGAASSVFIDMINRTISAAPASLAVRAGFRLLPVERPPDRRDGLLVDGVFLHTRNIVAAEFAQTDRVAVFVCTIGPALEAEAAALMRSGDPALGFVVDCVASAYAERTAAVLHDRIAARSAREGGGVTNRYSPGYCTWPVAEQHLLFSLLPPGFCGITLTESALMLPVKSVSGIIGVGSGVRRNPYRCDRCGVADCTHRSIILAENERRGKL
jgi:hypothetical protein